MPLLNRFRNEIASGESDRFPSRWFALIIIGFSVLVIYSNIYSSPFIYDDVTHIVENKTIKNLSNYFFPSKFLEPRAILDFTFALNYRFGKLNVFGYHLVNILIHILNGFLVYFLVFAILKQRPELSDLSVASISESPDFSIRTISLFSALIFVVHPIQTQAVTYTVQRYASMAAMFYMASILFYFKARVIAQSSKPKAQNSAFYFLSILCGGLAFLSKQNTASLPLAILLVEYLFIDRTWRKWKKKLPWFALAFTCWLLFVLFISGLFSGEFGNRNFIENVSDFTKETVSVGRWRYLCTQFNVLVIYVRLLFIPVRQNLDYMYPFKTGFFDGLTPLAFMFLIVIAGLGIWSIKRRPVITFSIFYFFITLSIESSIIPIRDALFEHRLYLPMLGFGLFVSYHLFYYLSNKRLFTLVLLFLIIVALGTATYQRNITWQDEKTLWSDVVLKSPHNCRAHNNLGFVLHKEGRTKEAIEHYLEALRTKPDYEKALNNMGVALNKQGRADEAIEHYLEALRINPYDENAHNNLGCALEEQGRIDQAIEHYLEALRIKPDFEKAHNNLGFALYKQGRTEEAIEHQLKAFQINPDNVKGYINLGNELAEQNRTNEAIKLYVEILRIRPDFVDARNNLGIVLFMKGDIEGAIACFREALRIKPDYVNAKNNLKRALMSHKQALESKPL